MSQTSQSKPRSARYIATSGWPTLIHVPTLGFPALSFLFTRFLI
jgi:hypothetical protein